MVGLRKFYSEMCGSVRLLLVLALGGVVIATLSFMSQRSAQQRIAKLEAVAAPAFEKFNRLMLHVDPELDIALHRLKDNPSVANLVETHELLLERAADPNSADDQLAWSWFVGVLGNHAEIHGRETDIWEWFSTEVVSESSQIMAAHAVRRASICVLREQGEDVPDWMLVTDADVKLASSIAPLKYQSSETSFTDVDVDSERIGDEDQ